MRYYIHRRASGTGPDPTAPVWSSSVNQSLTVGSAFSLDLDTLCTDPEGQPLTYTVQSGSLPNGITQSGTRGQILSGTPTTVQTVSPILRASDTAIAEASWIARSTAPGVTYATDFRSLTSDFHQTNHVFGANSGPGIAYWKSLVTQELSDSRLPYALRINSPGGTGANGASWIASLNSAWTSKTQGFDTTEFYLSWLFKIPSNRLTVRSSNGWKFMDISAYDPSNPQASISHTNFEIVFENSNWHQIPICYREVLGSPENGGSGGQVTFDLNDGTDIRVQTIDRGSSFPTQQRYCYYNGGNYGGDYTAPDDGCFYFRPNEWMAFKARVKIATYGGSAGNEFEAWGANEGATSWTRFYSATNFNIGSKSDGYTNGMCGLHLNAYETNYNNAGSDTYQLWSQLIVSTQDIALPSY
jgi:hypothetical protein